MITPSCPFSLPSRCPPLHISYLDQTLARFSRFGSLLMFPPYFYLIRVSTIKNAVHQWILSLSDLTFATGRTSTKLRASISTPNISGSFDTINGLKFEIKGLFWSHWVVLAIMASPACNLNWNSYLIIYTLENLLKCSHLNQVTKVFFLTPLIPNSRIKFICPVFVTKLMLVDIQDKLQRDSNPLQDFLTKFCEMGLVKSQGDLSSI